MNKLINIKIKRLYGTEEVLLETNSEKWEKEIKKLEGVKYHHGIEVIYSYADGTECGFDYPYNHNGFSPRKLIIYNNRNVYAEWNITGEYNDVAYGRLLEALVYDFLTEELTPALEEREKEYKKWLKETKSPVNKNIKVEKIEALDELKDNE